MEMSEMKLSHDVEKVKNRDNKSELSIFSLHPELFLAADVAYPDQVKYLTLNLYFDDYDLNLRTQIFDHYAKCTKDVYGTKCSPEWPLFLDEDICSYIVNFHNVQVLKAKDLNLSTKIWLEFIKNSKNLKEIIFSSNGCGDYDNFMFEDKIEVLETLFKIPTLEKVKIEWMQLYYFPSGPSNIKHLELDAVMAENEDLRKLHSDSWKTNFSTHTNITSLYLKHRKPTPYHLKDLRFDKMVQLEKIVLENWNNEYIEPVLMLPNLKRFEFTMWYDPTDPLMKNLIKNPDAIFASVEHIVIKVTNFPSGSDLSKAKKYLRVVLSKQCINLKSFTFKYTDSYRDEDNDTH